MRLLVYICLLLGSAMAAFGQLGEISVSMGRGSIRDNVIGSDTDPFTGEAFTFETDTNFRLGFRITFNTEDHFGHEVGYSYNRGTLRLEGPGQVPGTRVVQEMGMPIHQVAYSFLAYATREGSSIRPFLAGGGGFNSFYPPGSSVYYGNGETKFGFTYGGGIKVRITPIWMLRFDVREFTSGKPFDLPNQSGLLRQLETTAGLSFVF